MLLATLFEAYAAEGACRQGQLQPGAHGVPVWAYATGTTLFETDGPEVHLREYVMAYMDLVERIACVVGVPALRERLDAADDPVQVYESLEDFEVERHTEHGAWAARHMDQLKRSMEILEAREELPGVFITCSKCKSNSVDVEQKQTRSADEPMTVFCKCRACGKRFVMH